MKKMTLLVVVLAASVPLTLTLMARTPAPQDATGHDHMLMADQQPQQVAYTPPKNDKIPPGDPHVADALKGSPRHGEWVDVKIPGGGMVRSWVVYPDRAQKVGVVIAIHENRGINDWTRAVADQLAKDGFIGIAPDLLWGKGPNGEGTEAIGAANATQSLPSRDEVVVKLNAVMAYGKSLPSSNGKTGVVGFCWGGGNSFNYAAAAAAGLNAVASYYGPVPDDATLAKVQVPVLGLYGATDGRITLTVDPTATKMKQLNKSYDPHIYDGASHAFMHQTSEANYKAAVESWPLVVGFFAKNLR